MKKELEAIATIVGTIIGAGLLALPYSLYKSGSVLFLVSMLLGLLSSFLVTTYVAELSYSQKKIYQLPSL
ncbi:MAG: aromatic amino acid transport family protein, partial [Conexivisphaerales archaeon]